MSRALEELKEKYGVRGAYVSWVLKELGEKIRVSPVVDSTDTVPFHIARGGKLYYLAAKRGLLGVVEVKGVRREFIPLLDFVDKAKKEYRGSHYSTVLHKLVKRLKVFLSELERRGVIEKTEPFVKTAYRSELVSRVYRLISEAEIPQADADDEEPFHTTIDRRELYLAARNGQICVLVVSRRKEGMKEIVDRNVITLGQFISEVINTYTYIHRYRILNKLLARLEKFLSALRQQNK